MTNEKPNPDEIDWSSVDPDKDVEYAIRRSMLTAWYVIRRVRYKPKFSIGVDRTIKQYLWKDGTWREGVSESVGMSSTRHRLSPDADGYYDTKEQAENALGDSLGCSEHGAKLALRLGHLIDEEHE